MRKSAGAIALAVAVLGCSERSSPEITYRLVTSDDAPLPVLLQVDSCYHILKTGDVRIAGSKYASSFQVELACSGKEPRQLMLGASGSVAALGDSLLFHDTTGVDLGRGTLRSDTLTVQGPLRRLTYVRQ